MAVTWLKTEWCTVETISVHCHWTWEYVKRLSIGRVDAVGQDRQWFWLDLAVPVMEFWAYLPSKCETNPLDFACLKWMVHLALVSAFAFRSPST